MTAPELTTSETFTRYAWRDHAGPVLTATDATRYRIALVEITRSNFGLVNVTARGQRLRQDGAPDLRSGPLAEVPLSVAAADHLADTVEQAHA